VRFEACRNRGASSHVEDVDQGISSSAQGQLASLLLRCAENLEAALDAPARRA
jgi:hypothetical protein